MSHKQESTNPNRLKIVDEAVELFWTKGYDGTSVRDIATRCGYEAANLYNYFGGKEQILYEALLREHKASIAPIQHLAKSTLGPAMKLRELIRSHVRYVLATPMLGNLLFDTELRHLTTSHRRAIYKLRQSYNEILGSIISEGIANGQFRNTDERLVANLVASMIARSRLWYKEDGRLSPTGIADFISDFVLRGIENTGRDC